MWFTNSRSSLVKWKFEINAWEQRPTRKMWIGLLERVTCKCGDYGSKLTCTMITSWGQNDVWLCSMAREVIRSSCSIVLSLLYFMNLIHYNLMGHCMGYFIAKYNKIWNTQPTTQVIWKSSRSYKWIFNFVPISDIRVFNFQQPHIRVFSVQSQHICV